MGEGSGKTFGGTLGLVHRHRSGLIETAGRFPPHLDLYQFFCHSHSEPHKCLAFSLSEMQVKENRHSRASS